MSAQCLSNSPDDFEFELYLQEPDNAVVALCIPWTCERYKKANDEDLAKERADLERLGCRYIANLQISYSDITKISEAYGLLLIDTASAIASNKEEFYALIDAIYVYYLREHNTKKATEIQDIKELYKKMIGD